MFKNFYYSLILLFFSILPSCKDVVKEPQDPLWGKQNCSTCRMILSLKRFAVQRILPTGKVLFYDDMICALKDNQFAHQGTLYVRPFGGDTWVLANTVKYSSGLMTPMNSGYGADNSNGNINFDQVQKNIEESK